MKQHITVWVAAFTLCCLVFVASQGLAQATPQEITLTPTTSSPDIKPGTTQRGSFQVLNQGAAAYNFKVYSAPYSVKGENYTPDFTQLPTLANVANWFIISSTASHANPGQTIPFNYTITVPAGTPAGGYYAVIFAETQNQKSNKGITLNERVGEIFYIEVAGKVTQKGSLLTWSAKFLQKPPLLATIRLENSGGLHYSANIKVNVRDIFGRSKFSFNTTKEVLPQTIRRVDVSWAQTPFFGLFKVNGTIDFLNQQQNLPTKWVLVVSNPARIVIGALVGVFILFVLLRILYRHRKAKKSRVKYK